ncbi:50S ribosomal protein L29 [Candidatus Bipolaricaulota bacterium]|nr:50S ribosomal protein L29 [Candidatus Bipolaricaulota bacterium]MBS3813813.1 50S ribosomal protein L29 [Candidatus Bipolaricaulota bacterium]MBS3824932.1 50S ribosomal protein L29 [Candidatus Bipolaricaulota bacterium]
MRPGELRELTDEELEEKVDELKEKLFNLRFQKATGELDNTAEFQKTKKDIARVKTIRREREGEGVE